MNQRRYNIYFHTHTISGIVIAALLYVIFFAGSFSFFKDDITAWQKGTTAENHAQHADYNYIIDSLGGKYNLKGRNFDFYLLRQGNGAYVNMSASQDTTISKPNRRYDWYGNYKPNAGGERSKQLFVYKNNEGIANLTTNYKMGDRHSVSLSDVATTFKRVGENQLNPQANAYERDKMTFKNMLGLAYNYDIKDVWSISLFGKYLHQSNKDGDSPRGEMNRFGYGLASTYFLKSGFCSAKLS